MFSTLNRYFSKELAQTFAAVSLVLLLVIIGKSFVSLLAKVMNGKLPADVIMPMLGLGIVKSAILLVPFALLLTIMLVLGRYYCLLYTSPSPRDLSTSRMPSSA